MNYFEMPPKFRFALREDLTDQKQFLPTKAEPFATGWDVRAALPVKSIYLRPFEATKIPLGFRAYCSEGWWFELKPRSSSFAKKNLHCLYGTIDQNFEGQLMLACQYIPEVPISKTNHDNDGIAWDEYEDWSEYCGSHSLKIDFGEAIGQIIPVRRQEMTVEEVSNEDYDILCKMRNSARGSGGFGSTS